jgi:hypothetical protein
MTAEGAVLALSAAPVGRGANGVDAMAEFGNLMMMMMTMTAAVHSGCTAAVNQGMDVTDHPFQVGHLFVWDSCPRLQPGPLTRLHATCSDCG